MPYYHFFEKNLKTGKDRLIGWGGGSSAFTSEDIERQKRLHARDHPGKELIIIEKESLQDYIDKRKKVRRTSQNDKI